MAICKFGKIVKTRLVEIEQKQEWLIREVSKRTGLYFDTSYMHKILTGQNSNQKIMLYGACVRIAKAMGYKKVITYTLSSEFGASLRASNFIDCGECGGTHWTGSRNRGQDIPHEKKHRWELHWEK